MKGKPLSREQRIAIKHCYVNLGWSIRQISEATGTPRETVRGNLVRDGVTMRTDRRKLIALPRARGRTNRPVNLRLDSQLIVKLHQAGMSVREVAHHVKACESSVIYHLDLAGAWRRTYRPKRSQTTPRFEGSMGQYEA